MLLYQILAYGSENQQQIKRKTINLKYHLRRRMKSLNYLVEY